MAYVSVKRIKGRRYAYIQESYRVGKKVKTRQVGYIGAVSAAFTVIRVGVGLASMPRLRDKAFGTVDMSARVAEEKPVDIGGLGVSANFTAQQSFEHESGISGAP